MKQQTGEEKQKRRNAKKSKKGILILGIAVLLIIVGIVAGILLWKQKMPDTNMDWQQGGFAGQDMNAQGDVVSAYGVTSIGMDEETFPITNLENTLEIEEVYVSSGESVTAQTPLFKLTEESLETVLTELEEDLRAADLAYRAGVIEYEQSKITAYYEQESTLLTGKQAQEVYEETTSGLYDSVKNAKEALEEAQEEIAEYEAAIAGNTYYEDYQVAYYKNIYDENLAILQAKVTEWGVSWSEVTSGGSAGGNMMRSMESSSVSGGDAGTDLHSQYVTVLSSLYKVLEQNLKDYEDAQAAYEDAVENASFNLQTLKLQLSTLEQNYAEAKEKYETSILEAELTRETSLSNAEKAESNYEASMEKAEADFEQLKDDLEEAENNLTLFNERIKDGCYYGEGEGEVLRMNVRAGEDITSDSRIYMLKNMEEITVTVSVGQADIAKLNVGDSAMVQSTESGMYNGVVTAINPISTSESKSSISYSVTVTLSEGTDTLSANETAIVYFGMGNGAQKNEN